MSQKINNCISKTISILLSLVFLFPPYAFAMPDESGEICPNSEKLESFVEETLAEYGQRSDRISVALRDTGSGGYFFYNADTWFYTASLYKMPVVMTYANMLKNGEIQPDSMARPDDEVFGYVLEHSDYGWVRNLEIKMYGTQYCNQQMRHQDLEYAHFDEDELPTGFFKKSVYSARFCLGIMEELFNNSEDYPNVIEHMKLATPGKYFRKNLEDQYEIAQKYGSDRRYVHTEGIIYTEKPIIMVIMTFGMSDFYGDRLIGSLSEGITRILTEECDMEQ